MLYYYKALSNSLGITWYQAHNIYSGEVCRLLTFHLYYFYTTLQKEILYFLLEYTYSILALYLLYMFRF